MIIEIIIAILLGAGAMFGLIEKLRHLRKGQGISILVPFHCPDKQDQRSKNWHWLKRYWECVLPSAEIIMGEDRYGQEHGLPFSKSAAVNDAAIKAKGDIYVIVDADGFIDYKVVLEAAKRIRKARRRGHRLWFVPYRWFYRLTEDCSRKLLNSPHCNPHKFPTPPPQCCIQSQDGSQYGHWYGAGIQIMPEEAFWMVGGWDERFRGWGGEDHAAMRAMDTLYWRHKTLPVQFLHVWHPMISPKGVSGELVSWRERMWAGQAGAGANDHLSGRYYGANGEPDRMRRLVDEGREFKKNR